MLLDWMRHAQAYGREANGLILRKELIQLKDLIEIDPSLHAARVAVAREPQDMDHA